MFVTSVGWLKATVAVAMEALGTEGFCPMKGKGKGGGRNAPTRTAYTPRSALNAFDVF